MTTHYAMGNVQVRLPDDLERALEDLADEMHTNRSEALRQALDEGLQALRLERAIRAYQAEEMTLARAAAYAGVSLQRLARRADELGIARYRMSPEELDDDIDEARSFLTEHQDDAER